MMINPSPARLDRSRFISEFGSIYEHSPWVAEILFDQGLEDADNDPSHLATRMAAIVDAASHDQKLALLRAHPELAGKLAISELTDDSRSEQSGAGLDKCTPEEFARFQHLNSAYTEKFGFPFIIAVKGLFRTDILEAFEARITNTPEQEFQTALQQVHKIARLRLESL